MACLADKKAGYQLVPVVRPDVAVSIRDSFDAISAIAYLSLPLRRPKRVRPSREAEQDYSDTILAQDALADKTDVVSYEVFRKELGFSE